MDRDLGVHMMEAIGAIEKLLDDCPHGVAKKIKDNLAIFEETADSAFPGGYAGNCIYCEEPVGHDESGHVGDEMACNTCIEKQREAMRKCVHEFEDAGDTSEEPGRFCSKCGAFQPTEAEVLNG